jgi:hypothetical protein
VPIVLAKIAITLDGNEVEINSVNPKRTEFEIE